MLLLTGVALGALAGPVLGPALRPSLRRLVKGGLIAQRRLTGTVAGLREELEDIVAEAKQELESESGEEGVGAGEEPPGHGAH